MPQREIFKNPFYIAVVLAGASFGITAFATSLLAARAQVAGPVAQSPLTEFLDRRGSQLMFWQLGALATGVVGAMTTDSFWQRRAAARASAPAVPAPGESRDP